MFLVFISQDTSFIYNYQLIALCLQGSAWWYWSSYQRWTDTEYFKAIWICWRSLQVGIVTAATCQTWLVLNFGDVYVGCIVSFLCMKVNFLLLCVWVCLECVTFCMNCTGTEQTCTSVCEFHLATIFRRQ